MKSLFAIFLVVHGLVHLLGAAKAFEWGEIPQLTQPISRPVGALWLTAATLLLATAVSLFTWPRWWWAVGAGAVIVSQIALATSWSDARYGTIANAIALAAIALGFLSQGPWSFRAEYERDVERRLGRAAASRMLTEGDLVLLPPAVQRYVRLTGAVGQPLVQNFRARFTGRIRRGPGARWMPFTAEQYNFYDPPSRFFLMDASMLGIPFQAWHRYVGSSATMRVKVASLVQVADAKGREMDESETVTLFNDMCLFAPATLIERSIQWEQGDAHTVSASFTNAGHTVRAILSFNDAGELTNFVSGDRSAASPDGKTLTKLGWSTPVRDYGTFGSHRILAHGAGRWDAPSGEYAYIRLQLTEIEYNVQEGPARPRRQ